MVELACLVAIAAGAALRALIAIRHHDFTLAESLKAGDQAAYTQLALSLVHNGTFTIPRANDPLHWAPGGPIAFAAGLKLFGFGGSGFRGAYTAQAIISIATIGATFFAARRLDLSRTAALLVAAAIALSTGAIVATGDLITEPLGGLTLVCAVGVLAVVIRGQAPTRRALGGFALGGLLLGLAILVRPDYIVLPAAVVVAMLLAWRVPWSARVLACVVALVATAVPLVPWAINGHKETGGKLVLPTTSGVSTYWFGTYLPGDGTMWGSRRAMKAEVHRAFPNYAKRYPRRAPPAGLVVDALSARHPELSRDEALKVALRTNLREYAVGQPLSFARMEVEKLWRMWSRPFGGHGRPRTLLGNIAHIPALIAAALTLAGALWLRRRDPALLLIAAVLAVGTAINVLAVVEPRANVRFVPIAFLGAALVLARLATRRSGEPAPVGTANGASRAGSPASAR